MKTEITVLMSVFNGGPYLRKSIDSVLRQSFRDFEFLIVDDASTDGTPDIIKSYNDPRIRVISNERNIGLTKSLNRGLHTATGKYIARQDANDISLPSRLETQRAYLEKNPDIFLTGTGALKTDKNGKLVSTFRPITDEAALKRTLPRKNSVFHPSIMFRNTEGGIYREKFRYSQDYDLYLNLLSQKKRINNIPDILIGYRMLPDSVSFAQRARQELFAEKAREFYRQRISGGKDEYGEFDPESITSVNMAASCEKKLLGYEITARFEINDLKGVRNLYKKYLRLRKIPDKYTLYYLASFFPSYFINCFRKII